jgi:hypothetical protein
MRRTGRLFLYVFGAMLMAIPGLITTSLKLYFMASLAVGCLLLVTATLKNEVGKPKTALLLLAISNSSFWLSYTLWLIRPKLLGPQLRDGIDPFLGPLAFWLVVLAAFMVCEGTVFLAGIAANRQRAVAAAGLVALIAQLLLTCRTVYAMVHLTLGEL